MKGASQVVRTVLMEADGEWVSMGELMKAIRRFIPMEEAMTARNRHRLSSAKYHGRDPQKIREVSAARRVDVGVRIITAGAIGNQQKKVEKKLDGNRLSAVRWIGN